MNGQSVKVRDAIGAVVEVEALRRWFLNECISESTHSTSLLNHFADIRYAVCDNVLLMVYGVNVLNLVPCWPLSLTVAACGYLGRSVICWCFL